MLVGLRPVLVLTGTYGVPTPRQYVNVCVFFEHDSSNCLNIEDIVNLTLNIKKTNFVIFSPAQRKLTFQPNITIFDNANNKYVSLERKEFVKYLGIFIDQNLTWKHHIDHVAFKISRYVRLLSKLHYYVPTHTSNHLSLSHFTTSNLWLVSLGLRLYVYLWEAL